MKKAVGSLVVATFVSFGVTAVLVACSEDDKSTFDTNRDSGGPETSTGIFDPNPTPPRGDGATEPVTCDPQLPGGYTEQWIAPHATKACSAANAEEWFDNCFGATSSEACTNWIAANEACASCIEASDGSGPVRVGANRVFEVMNMAACISIANDSSGPESCAAKYYISEDCALKSCEGCYAKGGNFDSFTACRNAAWAAAVDGKSEGACYEADQAWSAACVGADARTTDCKETPDEVADFQSGDQTRVLAATRAVYTRNITKVCVP